MPWQRRAAFCRDWTLSSNGSRSGRRLWASRARGHRTHAGLVLFDISTPEKAAEPELLGFVVPKGRHAVPYLGYTTNPAVYDAIPRGRHVFYVDFLGAFHVAEMDPTRSCAGAVGEA